MAEKFSRYDTADYLKTEKDIRLYLEACQEDGDPSLIHLICIIAPHQVNFVNEETGRT